MPIERVALAPATSGSPIACATSPRARCRSSAAKRAMAAAANCTLRRKACAHRAGQSHAASRTLGRAVSIPGAGRKCARNGKSSAPRCMCVTPSGDWLHPGRLCNRPDRDGIGIVQAKVDRRAQIFRDKWLDDPSDDTSTVTATPRRLQYLQTLTEMMLNETVGACSRC